MLVILLSIYNSFVIPLQFSMPKSFDNHPWTETFDQIIDWIFYLDIIINFRTKFIDPKNDEFVSDSK